MGLKRQRSAKNMTSWVKLSLVSWASAIPFVAGFLHVRRFDLFKRADFYCRRFLEDQKIFTFLMVGIGCLYVASLKEPVSFDEYNYALGLREGLYVGPNHFLSHLISYLIYAPLRSFTSNTLLIRQLMNVMVGLIALLAVRRISFKVTDDRALSNSCALFLGVTFGFWKFAASAEVYPVFLLMWVLSIEQGVAVFSGDHSWKRFLFLSLFSNLTVLAHDMGSLMAPAFLIAFLVKGGVSRKKLVTRYVVSGLLLFPLLQLFSTMCAQKHSLAEYINLHLWYYHHPDTQPGDYDYSVLKNVFVIAREGLYSMMTGIESGWPTFSRLDVGKTFVVYGAFAASLFSIYFLIGRNFVSTFRKRLPVDSALVLVALNATAIYCFCLFWRPNDEVHHWLLPFVALLMAFAIKSEQKIPDGFFALTIPLLVFTMLTSSGLYSFSSQKNMTQPKKFSWLKAVGDKSHVFGYNQSIWIMLRYFRPGVLVTDDCEKLNEAAKEGKTVLIEKKYFDCFKQPPFTIEPWQENPDFYYPVESHPKN
jgi:hypothetical protein